MKQYVDEKFWHMFSAFVTLLAVSVVFLIAIKIHKESNVLPINTSASVIGSDRR